MCSTVPGHSCWTSVAWSSSTRPVCGYSSSSTPRREAAFDFTVLCGNGQVRRVLRESGLDGVLAVVDPSGAVPASDSPV